MAMDSPRTRMLVAQSDISLGPNYYTKGAVFEATHADADYLVSKKKAAEHVGQVLPPVGAHHDERDQYLGPAQSYAMHTEPAQSAHEIDAPAAVADAAPAAQPDPTTAAAIESASTVDTPALTSTQSAGALSKRPILHRTSGGKS